MSGAVWLGAIMCSVCEELIETFDAEKVTVYYSVCTHEECVRLNGNRDRRTNLRNGEEA